jgi:hypothetical protein
VLDDVGAQQLLVRLRLKITQRRERRSTKITRVVDQQIQPANRCYGGYQLLAMRRISDVARDRAHGREFRQSPSGAGKRLRVPCVDREGPAATS